MVTIDKSTLDKTSPEDILKPGEKLPSTITIEKGRFFDGDRVFRYTTGSNGKLPDVNELGALVTLIGRVDKMNPRFRYENRFMLVYLTICIKDDYCYTWQEILPRILSWLRGETGF